MRTPFVIQALSLLFGLGQAAPVDDSAATKPELVKRAPTCHTPSNRACWTNGFNIQTDYEAHVPRTGVVRRYTFNINEHHDWVGGDGRVKKVAMLVNDVFPGPTITADWGDEIEVTVNNNLEFNGTSIHWHGIRMLNNNVNDGANGITECPIPPGASKKYRFLAEQYGTSWYHSHFSSQYANGITGSMVINGPASLPYEEDLGVLAISDWYYDSADEKQRSLIPPPGIAPPSDNILFNGKHVDGAGLGSYHRMKLKPGKRHRLRLVNPSVDNTYMVSIVDHDMTIIATDFVPVNSYTTSSIFMAVGQRYDVTIDASKAPGNYWLNVTLSGTGACGTIRSGVPPPAMILDYEGVPQNMPTKAGTKPQDTFCEDNTNLVPIVTRNANANAFHFDESNDLPVQAVTKPWEDVPNRVYWNVHGQDMNITWEDPTLEYIAAGDLDFPDRYNLFTVNNANQWSYWVIENIGPAPHPMHLHGHDFLIIGRSPAQSSPFGAPIRRFNPATDVSSLRFNNPTRRDTTMLPANGWLVIAFKVDNPGAWLFHCHIAWHVGQGLSVQFLERVNDIPSTVSLDQIEPICSQWTDYYATSPYKQFDSGLRL